MAASTIYSAEYDLLFYAGDPDDPNRKEYVLSYTIPDVPETLESTLFDEGIPQFNSQQQSGVVGSTWTYPATDLPLNSDPPQFSHIKEARFIETIRTPIE